jgi:hypothetical protein
MRLKSSASRNPAPDVRLPPSPIPISSLRRSGYASSSSSNSGEPSIDGKMATMRPT